MGAIRRGFVDLDEGQIHYRHHPGPEAGTPLVMLHQASGSARTMAPLMPGFARSRAVWAIDLPGNGDSCPPADPEIDMAGYADAAGRAIDALGLDRPALYGFHAGAGVALELALARPDRVAAVILDSLGLYDAGERRRMAQAYLPDIPLDRHGGHLLEAWHYVRDTYLFWPWFEQDAAHARAVGVPPTPYLHDKVMEVLKALPTFAQLYRAAFEHDKQARLPLLSVPTLVTAGGTNSQRCHVERIAALVPGAGSLVTPGTYDAAAAEATARLLDDWLRGLPVG